MSVREKIRSFFRRSRIELAAPETTTVETAKLGIEAEIKPEELERVYLVDEIVQGIVHKYIVAILAGGLYIDSPDENLRNTLEDFIRRIKLESELREVIRDIFVYGTGYLEIVYNRGRTDITKVVSIDPKTIDFLRDEATREIILDPRTKEPKGFKWEIWTPRGKQEKTLRRDKVAIFKFFNLSGQWRGFSPLETLVNVVTYRKNVDRGIGESGYRSAFPAYVLYIGDKDVYPSPPQSAIKEGAKKLRKIGTQTIFSFPWYYSLERLPIEGMKELSNFSDHFINEICSALLFPKTLLTVPERASGTVLERQLAEWEKTVEGFQKILANQLSEQILDRYCNLKGLEKNYKLKFRILSPVTERDRARTVASLVRAGAILPGPELDKYLRIKFGIPLEKREIPQLEANVTRKLLKELLQDIIEEIKEEIRDAVTESRDIS